jgi:ribonuclease T2
MIRHRELSLVPAVLILLASLTFASSATARHRNSSGAEPGAFDYYLLSLSWSPAFCLSDPGAAECSGPRRFGFIVHGLWPQYEKGWPEHCDVHQPVPDNVVSGVSDIMPARSLVFHEWSAHGTCSGLDPQASFLQANPKLASQSLVVTCSRQDAPRLREVHICLDRNLNPRGCSADVLRGACRAATLIVPPIR